MTSASPSSAAARWAPALVEKFSSVQVSPDSQYSAGARAPASACGGRYTEKVISQRVLALAWRKRRCQPPKQRWLDTNSSVSLIGGSLGVEVNHGADRLAFVHQIKRRIDVFQRHGVGDEVVQA